MSEGGRRRMEGTGTLRYLRSLRVITSFGSGSAERERRAGGGDGRCGAADDRHNRAKVVRGEEGVRGEGDEPRGERFGAGEAALRVDEPRLQGGERGERRGIPARDAEPRGLRGERMVEEEGEAEVAGLGAVHRAD